MKFDQPLAQGRFLRRYKRFLADIELASGQVLTVHCPNTGSMKNCLVPGAPAWYSTSLNAARKYPHTWEIATSTQGHHIGINTARANPLVREAIEQGVVESLRGYGALAAEVPYGQERSRADLVVEMPGGRVYIEVKSLTLLEADGRGYFPDAVSLRAAKHVRELTAVVAEGHRAMLIYCVQHSGIDRVAPARHIDPIYAEAVDLAVSRGVEVLALGAELSPEGISLRRRLPVEV